MSFVVSVNLGRTMASEHASIGITGIDKRPVDRPVLVRAPGRKGVGGSGLAGDQVCDLRHHGGNDQAVYAYAREDLDAWSAQLGRDLPAGSFGENLTTAGIDISRSVVGERWAVGDELILEITDPRIPCRTFAGWLGLQGWVKRFTQQASPGTYFRVIREGSVRTGDRITVLDRPDHGITVRTAFRAFTTAPELLPQLIPAVQLSPEARESVARRVPILLDSDSVAG